MAFTNFLDPCLRQVDCPGPSLVSLEPVSLFPILTPAFHSIRSNKTEYRQGIKYLFSMRYGIGPLLVVP